MVAVTGHNMLLLDVAPFRAPSFGLEKGGPWT